MVTHLTYSMYEHQGKGRVYAKTLRENGWREVHISHPPTVCFWDSDVTRLRKQRITNASDSIKQFVYPHAARPPIFYDVNNGWSHHPKIVAQFVQTDIHKKILEICGYTTKIYVTGWTYSEILPFRETVREVKNIVFAPIHPNMNGWMHDIDKDLNRKTMNVLIDLKKSHPSLNITIRYIRSLEGSGLSKVDGFNYVLGQPDLSTREIKASDLVISHETYAYLAVALGVPTLMMGEDVVPHIGNTLENFSFAQRWDQYKEYLTFPLDILDTKGEDTWTFINKATKLNPDVEKWKKNMIGEPFNKTKFVQIIKSHL